MKRLWLVRLGRHGQQEAHALDTGELVLGFPVGDLRGAKDGMLFSRSLSKRCRENPKGC
jgi:restriction system protein